MWIPSGRMGRRRWVAVSLWFMLSFIRSFRWQLAVQTQGRQGINLRSYGTMIRCGMLFFSMLVDGQGMTRQGVVGFIILVFVCGIPWRLSVKGQQCRQPTFSFLGASLYTPARLHIDGVDVPTVTGFRIKSTTHPSTT